jgi:rubredoxin
MVHWHCSECGCGYDEAQTKRRRRGEPPIGSVIVQTCSRACEEKRQDRLERARQERRARERRRAGGARRRRRRTTNPSDYWRRRYRRLRAPHERSWRCRECGCSFSEAQAKRRRRGEPAIRSLKMRTCSAHCRSIYRTRIIRRWERLHPKKTREYWHRARAKRRRKRLAMKHGRRGEKPIIST